MKRFLIFLLLLSAGTSFAANRIALGNASVSSGANWTSGIAPNCTTDTVDTGAFIVTADIACAFGSSGSGVGHGVNVSAAGGKFICNPGITCTFRGFDNGSNRPFTDVANSTLDFRGANILIGQPSDIGSTPLVNGNILVDAATTGDTADASTWGNTSGNNVYSNRVSNPMVNPPNTYCIKPEGVTASLTDPGPISNAAGTALGSFGNTSLIVSTGGFDSNGGSIHNEKDGSSVFKGTADLSTVLTTNGDYIVFYEAPLLCYKSSSSVLTVTFAFNYGKWFGYSILAQNNAANSAVTVDGHWQHMGSSLNGNAEQTGGSWMVADKYISGAAGADATRLLTIGTHFICDYCSRPIQVYCQNINCTDSTHHLVIDQAILNYSPWGDGTFRNGGMISLGYMNYADVTNTTVNSVANLFVSLGRSNATSQKNITVSGLKGNGSKVANLVLFAMLPGLAAGSSVDTGTNNVYGVNNPDILGVGGSPMDGSVASICGNSTDGANTFSGHFWYGYRAGRAGEYCSSINIDFAHTNHHGYTLESRSGYFDGTLIVLNHVDTWGLLDAGNFPGGCTPSYNNDQWVDKYLCQHNTFEGGTRSVELNDSESSVSACTRCSILDNNLTNNLDGIFLPTAGATTNISNVGFCQLDYNNDFQNSTNPTNIKQGTFMLGGTNYACANLGKTAVGVYPFNPSYSLPDNTKRSIVEAVSGTLGAGGTKDITVSWGGGTAVSFLDVLTAGGARSSTLTAFAAGLANCRDGTVNCPILTDSAASFATAGTGLKTHFLMLTSGACSGKVGFITSNNATAITLFAQTRNGSFSGCTPAAGDSYIIVKPHQQIFDSGAVQSIFVQLYAPELLPGTNTTYTDANITIAKNYPGTSGANNGVNPNYIDLANGNLTPTNAALIRTASDGTTIGSSQPVSSQTSIAGKLLLSGKVTIH